MDSSLHPDQTPNRDSPDESPGKVTDAPSGFTDHELLTPSVSGDALGETAEPTDTRRPIPAVTSPWLDTLGVAASRSAQILLIAAVSAAVIWLLLTVSVVVVATLVALILASAVAPLVRWLVAHKWSRLLATITALVGIVVVLGTVITGIVFAVRNEWDELYASAVDGWQELQNIVVSSPLPIETSSVDEALQQSLGFLSSGAFIGGALTGITAATEIITGVVLMVVILFFFLKDGPTIWNFILRWFHGSTRAKFAESGDRTIQVLGGYVRGTAIIAAVDAVCIGIPLGLLGVPLALPLSAIVFVGAFLPIVGATVAGILAAVVALVTNGPGVALIVIIIVIVVNQLEGDLLQPVVMGRTLSLHSIVVLLALATGTIISGFFGAVLAVPLAAVAWSVIQVWTNTYQVGYDPVLGEDPVNPKNRVEAKASMVERWKYQQMHYQRRFNRKASRRTVAFRQSKSGGAGKE